MKSRPIAALAIAATLALGALASAPAGAQLIIRPNEPSETVRIENGHNTIYCSAGTCYTAGEIAGITALVAVVAIGIGWGIAAIARNYEINKKEFSASEPFNLPFQPLAYTTGTESWLGAKFKF